MQFVFGGPQHCLLMFGLGIHIYVLGWSIQVTLQTFNCLGFVEHRYNARNALTCMFSIQICY